MQLVRIIDQHRRDFTGEYKCENCGDIWINKYGYDDRNYHDNVMPARKCEKCGKSTNDLGIPLEQVQTRYPEGEQH